MEFFQSVITALQCVDPHQKIEQCSKIYKNFARYDFAMNAPVYAWKEPSFTAFCTVVDPQKVPRRKRFDTKEGRAILLHAIAHIEYSAIDLALDAAQRFRNLPQKFYSDWIKVAYDECRHFLMIERLLHELGYRYGDFPVHSGLYDAAKATPTLIGRMSVVPRYLEANGLDANPKIIQKLAPFKDPFAQKIREALNIILQEEIDHVKRGDYWFRWACKVDGIDDLIAEYMKQVERVYPGTLHSKKDLNIAARKAAGFVCEEIELLAKDKISCK
ncbi:ferritin-like domain-containing protein [Nitratiruptor sp. YY09-18]|uniref:ferritin-like domain-containing protein n=1 Tax=Nitratiruptor sp. YY09-18 TaxID=2724901 RepID=UPI00191610E6|nr:ferritin-like domain-containing protein [Nitratiruptor sp. YY09-18]BCD68247.1 hypothetical protein NitYY0918_C1158 [Nitratiruptor sp. YY09-18]